jgi:hypothetical protein
VELASAVMADDRRRHLVTGIGYHLEVTPGEMEAITNRTGRLGQNGTSDWWTPAMAEALLARFGHVPQAIALHVVLRFAADGSPT